MAQFEIATYLVSAPGWPEEPVDATAPIVAAKSYAVEHRMPRNCVLSVRPGWGEDEPVRHYRTGRRPNIVTPIGRSPHMWETTPGGTRQRLF